MDLIRKIFEYKRMVTARVEATIHRVRVGMMIALEFGGLPRLGTSPAGGTRAGPFKSARIFSDSVAVGAILVEVGD